MSRTKTHPLPRRAAAALAALTLAALAAGCSSSNNNGPQPPVEYGDRANRSSSGNTYRVQRGDTIYGVAR